MISGAKTPMIWLLLAYSDRLASAAPSQDRPSRTGKSMIRHWMISRFRAFQKSGNNIPDGKPQAQPGHSIMRDFTAEKGSTVSLYLVRECSHPSSATIRCSVCATAPNPAAGV